MHVVNYLPYDDIGGVGFRTARAFNQYRPDWTYHAYRGAPSYLQFPEHTPWDHYRIIEDWNNADVVHVHDHLPQVGDRKPVAVTFHGTGYREQSDLLLSMSAAVNARVLVSTLDLWLQHPQDSTWMPQMDDIDGLATYRRPTSGPLRIGHAPTNRSLKSTHEFLEACERLNKVTPIEVVLIENQSWEQCLQLKGTLDILFDQTAYGYGGNAIEAWAMGIPVVCGAADNTLDEYQHRFGYLPFVEATPSTIYTALLDLTNPQQRTYWGAVGHQHADKYHSYRYGVERLAPIYQALAAL